MKFSNVFLASLLFFGVTPLALEKKRDEHALTITSTPLATTSTVALVTPDDAGVVEITGGTHDVLEARARGSRGGSSRKTTRASRTKKTKTKTKKKTEGEKTKTKCTAAMKKAGKCPAETTCTAAEKKKNGGKCPATCTAAEKKQNGGKCPTCTAAEKKKNGGKCPNKKRNWEVLFPTKGCRPKGAKKGTTGAKGGKKSDKKTTRDLFSPQSLTLSKRAVTFEPAAKTEAGLNAWTKDVWASSPKVLHMPGNSFEPTSFFKSWASLGQGVNFVTVKSLMGCTSVVAVSDEGVYVVSSASILQLSKPSH
jgi:hypothetical protein